MRRKALLNIINESMDSDPSPRFASSKGEAIVILESGGIVSNLSDFSESKVVMSIAVQRDGRNLKHCCEKFKKNDKFVMPAIQNYGEAILDADEHYKSNDDAVTYAFISSAGTLSLNDVDPKYKKHYNIAFLAALSNPDEINNFDISLINNKEFMNSVYAGVNQLDKKDSYIKTLIS